MMNIRISLNEAGVIPRNYHNIVERTAESVCLRLIQINAVPCGARDDGYAVARLRQRAPSLMPSARSVG
jgi:hypothetical protein